jgi:4-diphosphocytidyl-2-C-methyl-D-erythritol kinase
LTWPAAPAVPPPLALRLEKRIPIAAGLAGGSSDAAAALDAALEAWGADASDAERVAIAGRLGSDVPFFLTGGLALVEGRGERVKALPDLRGGSPAVLLVTPGFGISTADVFAAFAAGGRSPDHGAVARTSAHFADELAAGALGVSALVDRAGVIASANDLVAATALVAPAVPRLRRALARLLGRRVGQSGSGPTAWALYPSLVEGRAAAALVEEAFADGRLDAAAGPPFVAVAELLPRSMPGRPEANEEERR